MNKTKYVLTKSGEEVAFGDIISTTLNKKVSGGSITKTIEFMLTEDTLQYALELGIIKEVEVKKQHDTNASVKEDIKQVIDDHELRLESLENYVKGVYDSIQSIINMLTEDIASRANSTKSCKHRKHHHNNNGRKDSKC